MYRWEFTERGKEFELGVKGRLLVNDAGLMLDAALGGVGLAYQLESSVAEHVRAGRLIAVLSDFSAPFPGFFLYYPSRAHLAPKLRALVDFLKWKPRRPPAR